MYCLKIIENKKIIHSYHIYYFEHMSVHLQLRNHPQKHSGNL